MKHKPVHDFTMGKGGDADPELLAINVTRTQAARCIEALSRQLGNPHKRRLLLPLSGRLKQGK